MRQFIFILVLFGMTLSTPAIVQAENLPSRCESAGPLALSGHTGFLMSLKGTDRKVVIEEAEGARILIGLYRELGCPMENLYNAMECIASDAKKPENREKKLPDLSLGCMKIHKMMM